ncbi:MAG TPA: zinc ribbon domain-containing protein [Burkholderiales bacterium]|nr:zinc ribbon domain-containing protein [Burkholderiales bacterium]
MPIYEYRCEACGHTDEHLQKVSEAPLTVCPACGKPQYRKQLSAAGFQLKGTGWYATDFKTTGKKPAEKKSDTSKDDKSESKPQTKTDGKSESKSESKSETKAAA